MGWEFWWIGGGPGALQYVVWRFADCVISMYYHGWLGKIEEFFGMDKINMIEIDSCDRLQVGMIESSSDHDVAYPILEGFA